MTKFLEASKNRIIAVTLVFLFCSFSLFSVIDLEMGVSDRKYYTEKINDIFKNIINGEISWLNMRTTNYISLIVAKNRVEKYVLAKDKAALDSVFEPVIDSFNKRQVPVFAIEIVGRNGKTLYEHHTDQAAIYANHAPSQTVRAAFATGKPAYGFEANQHFLYHNVALPLTDGTGKELIGVLKISTSPAYFHLALKYHFNDVKTIIVQDNARRETSEYLYTLPEDPVWANAEKRRRDVEFYRPFIAKFDVRTDSASVKVDRRQYQVTTAARFLSVGGEELGRILAAYETTDLQNRQWTSLFLWVAFFALTVSLMFLVNFVGFRKYERIIREQGKLLAHRSKQSALGEMLSYIGHQWRQPLNALSLTIQNIELQSRLGRLDTALLESQVQHANRNIAYLTQTIEDWRALLTSGTVRRTVDLASSVDRALSIVSPVLDQCRIRVENEIAGTYTTCGFSNDLVQLTVNVLLNAKDALVGREGDRLIRVSCHTEGSKVSVTFQDNGGGIPAKLLPRIFEAYQTSKEDSGGTGLGLYLSRQIAENLEGGSLRAENREFEFEGQRHFGACITLEFKTMNEESCGER